jgi:hypothetical protein
MTSGKSGMAFIIGYYSAGSTILSNLFWPAIMIRLRISSRIAKQSLLYPKSPPPAHSRHIARDFGLGRPKKGHMHDMAAHSQGRTDLFIFVVNLLFPQLPLTIASCIIKA